MIDDVDFEKVSQFTWALVPQGYARRNKWIREAKKYKKVYLHRFIMNTPDGIRVDHINHNKLDCRRANMRNVPCSLNNLNRVVPKNHPTGVNGVLPTKSGKYLVTMSINNKTKRFGVFPTLQEAVKIRKKLEQKRYDGCSVV